MTSTWQTKKLEDCLDKVSYTTKIQRKKFLNTGNFPIVSQESELINGYWNDEKDLFRTKGPVVIFGDHTKILKYVDFDFVLGADGVKILKPKKYINTKFFYYFLQSVNLKNLGYARHYRLLREVKVTFPESFIEQQRIVKIIDETFEKIDKAKENIEKNLQNSKDIFKSYLQNILGNYKDKWAEKKICEVCFFDKTPHRNGSLPYVGLEDIESNSGKFIGSLNPKKVKSNSFHFTNEHVLYGRLRPYLNKVLLPSFEGHCSTEIFPIKTDKSIDRGFLFYWLISEKTVKKINATWTGARMPRANMNAVLSFKIPVPTIKEQKEIVEKLNSLSEKTKKLESIYKQKLADLEELKKSILNKAFNGEL